MIGFALTALGWLAESFMVALAGKAVDRAVQQFGEQHGVEDDLKKLKDSLANAMLQISTIENLWLKDEVLQQRLKELLIDLKDAAYDADDLFDEFQYRILKQQIEQQGDEAGNRASSSSYSTPPPGKKIKTSLSSYASGLFGKGDDDDNNNNDVQRMREIKGRLDDNSVALEKIYSSLGTEDDRGKKQLVSSESRQTSSFSIEPQLFGRDKELQQLKDLLLKSEVASKFGQSGVSVLSIDGIGGIGKTTLAQEVFNDSSVEEYFKLRIWVCVSENFSTERLTREITEYTTKEKCNVPNFAALQVVLKEKITQERFLLVLDDVWNEERHKWESLCAPLRFGKPGSKILVTTRSRSIAGMVGDVDPIHLDRMDEKSFWEFFKKCAFGFSNSGVHDPHLEAMAKKMTCKLKGLPLAAKTLGGLLSKKLDEQHWKSILDSEIWQLPQEENGIMPALQLSYQYLPPHLKQCFAFCSLFPKDYKFSESELIGIWIAEGFIVHQGSIRMEELGSNYFHELVNRSFFQKSTTRLRKQGSRSNYFHELVYRRSFFQKLGTKTDRRGRFFIESSTDGKFVMHDLIHDLAELISMSESYRVEKGKSHAIPSTIRHLSLHKEEKGTQTRCLTEFSHYNKLRTLNLSFGYTRESFIFDCGVLEKFKKIRVLDLSHCALRELPDNIGMLIHLRYLDLSWNQKIRRLPESLCNLYNLQTLILRECINLESLPHGMMKLINLRKLDAMEHVVDKFIHNITEIGKLTSLQNLSTFKVLKDNGHKLAELNGLKRLRGKLCITNLENVENKDEASIASLNSKEHLNRLELQWTSLQESDSDDKLHISEQVLEGLQPHHNLQWLTIRGYNGARPPNWLHEQVYSRLEALQLQNCKNWNDLLVIGQLSQLKHLSLVRIPVQIQNLHNLFNPKHCKFFSQLEELVLEGITMLEDLPNLGQLPSLKSLDIRSLTGVKMIGDKFFAAIEGGSCFPKLHTLRFNNMSAWEEFYCSDDRNLFPCLDLLNISNCQKLLMLPRLPPSITCLQLNDVGLEDCPRFWKAIDEGSSITNSASVTELSIQECPNLKILEEGLLAHHLQQIYIHKCEQLSSVPVKRLKELTSLWSLSITECPKLTSMTQDECIDFQLPPLITELCLSDCGNISISLPGCLHNLSSLTVLIIGKCSDLVSLPIQPLFNLNRLIIENCNELRSVGGLLIKSLMDLEITGCPMLQLSQREAQTEKLLLRKLVIDDTAFMQQSPIKNSLSSVEILSISSSCEAVMFEGEDQESLQSLTSLYQLSFSDCKNLQFLPTKLYTLTSLQVLRILNCPQIQSLPEKGLPPALINLVFRDCHLALEQQLLVHLEEIKKSGRCRGITYG
ncbi:disease resistance protein RGA2-like [Zingiber officinale]|uniref:Uncharacterized protein n=1 Tax=Zingiber officinale TaxID=94328 RepID=A0A8J5HLF1_ZINOF|nr:disease resistance protein RGA2-like [Zingiber officinale]KAG6530853.1 hypothetical protein ZIOFF_004614 [Zingiber officinale]